MGFWGGVKCLTQSARREGGLDISWLRRRLILRSCCCHYRMYLEQVSKSVKDGGSAWELEGGLSGCGRRLLLGGSETSLHGWIRVLVSSYEKDWLLRLRGHYFWGRFSCHTACKVSKQVKSVWGGPGRNPWQLLPEARGKKSRCGMSLSAVPFWLKVRLLGRDSVDVFLPAYVQAVSVAER